MWLTERERVTLSVLGAAVVLGFGVLLWQQRHPPLAIEPGPTPPYADWTARLDAARRVDLNHADLEQLERLPEIGPSIARRIVEYRAAHGPFRAVDELVNVPGIGPQTVTAVQDYIIIR